MTNFSLIFSIFCGLIIAGVLLTGCTTDEGEKQLIVDKKIVIGPQETVSYDLRYSGNSATDIVLTSDIPVNIDSDYINLFARNVTNFNKRIFYIGNPQRGFLAVLPGDKVRVINPDALQKANVQIKLTGVKLYQHL